MNSINRVGQIGPPRFGIAVHALVWLAQSKCVLSSGSIACEVNSHATFLRRVLARLVQAGIVEAREGRDGGYLLKARPNELSLADVYVAVKPDAAESEENMSCGGESGKKVDVALEEIMQEAERNTISFLAGYTLADLMNRIHELDMENS
ncbi:RrF2 family transcriptional regulator [Paenibacillus contaminans]|uniref:Rrf2 family transcriptional regulator n=1 Tax=Paenibacillus contaminans TaxID=450362 RepID=A0A329MK22_9BACL|nr:Rrf2 family transcriptional regulator [Paenibacillus contaminans]RAV19928.1 Rrf2 family transcriptional regulator [Paenibacillus contaminans]